MRLRKLPIATAVLLAAAAGAVGLSACASLSKPELERRLLELPKNKLAAARGYSSREATIELAGSPTSVEFRWLQAGDAGKPRILLVHGTPGSALNWSGLIFGGEGFAGLATDFEVFALEIAGHGSSRTQLDEYSFQLCADYVRGFLATLDLRDVCIVGQSYGGEFAWRAALDAPERISRLVLIDSAGLPRLDGEWLPEEVKLREWSVARLGWLFNSRERIRGALQPHFQAPVDDQRVEEMYLSCQNADNWSAVVDLARDENGLRSPELGSVRQPCLLVWGALDIAYTPERIGKGFAAAIPGARLELIPDCGHYPHEERPAELARLLRDFMR